MALTDQQLASALIGSAGAGQIANVMRGVAVADSADGRADVLITGSVVGAADATGDSLTADSPSVVSLATIGHVAEGEPVVILTSGSAGGAHSMVAIGAIGGGDRESGSIAGFDSRISTLDAQLAGSVIRTMNRWTEGTLWRRGTPANVSDILLDGMLIASGPIESGRTAIWWAHVGFYYAKNSSDAPWTTRTIASLIGWSFVSGQVHAVNSATRALRSDSTLPYVLTTGSEIQFGHADTLAAASGNVEADIIALIQHS